uniref:Helicase VP6 n=1 Tax=Changuinola virus TaxID=40052 RepID=U5YIJ3_9REOV|nr:helicase VP6 [Changuinola virus]
MSIAVLLVPGDLIEKIRPELSDRQIQVDLVGWKPEREENAEETTSAKEESHRGGLGEKDAGGGKEKKEEKAGDKENRERSEQKEGGTKKDAGPGGGGDDRGGDGVVGNADGGHGVGAEGAGGKRMVVMTEDIARKIKQKIGVDVQVYPAEGTVLFLERHVQNELLMDKESAAQQQEVFKTIQKIGKKDQKIQIDRVMSMKKLTDMLGSNDVVEKPISARQSGVKLVTNNPVHIKRATAYFTAPTGDINWKNVAREAAKNANIMAYHSESDDIAKDLLHLIDHL